MSCRLILIAKVVGFRRGEPLCQRLGLGVLLRNGDIGERPFHADRGIIPADGRLGLRVVDACALVLDFSWIGECAETTRKASGRPNHSTILCGALYPDPLPERRGTLSNID